MILNDAKHIMINGSPAVRVITGGSVVYCRRPDNLNQIAYCEAKTAQGLTYLSTDRTCTTELTGTLSASNSCTIFNNPDPVNSYKLAIIDITGGMNTDYNVIIKYKSSGNTTLTGNSIYTIQTESGGARWIRIYPIVGKTYDHYKIKVAIVNLTDMYGAGNEPETINDVKFQDLVWFLNKRWGYYLSWKSNWNNLSYDIDSNYNTSLKIWRAYDTGYVKINNISEGILEAEILDNTVTTAYSYGVKPIYTRSLVSNHKYFVTYKVKCNKTTDWSFEIGNTTPPSVSSIVSIGDWIICDWISSPTQLTNSLIPLIKRVNITTNPWEVGDKYYIKDVGVVDLTEIYGSGNEPTSLSSDDILNIKKQLIAYPNIYDITKDYNNSFDFYDYQSRTTTSGSYNLIHIDGVQQDSVIDTYWRTRTKQYIYLPSNTDITLHMYCKCENCIQTQYFHIVNGCQLRYVENGTEIAIAAKENSISFSNEWTEVTLEFRTADSNFYKVQIAADAANVYGIGSYVEVKDISITIGNSDNTLDSFVLDGGVLA